MDMPMIEVIDFDGWLKTYKPEDPEYYAIYDPETFKVTGVYPKGPAEEKKYKIKIETVVAEEIVNGVLSLSLLSVDVENEDLVISEKELYINTETNFYKLKSRAADLISVSLSVKYVKNEKNIYFTASDNLLKQKEKFKDYNLPCLFYITDQNDPNMLFETIEINLTELFASKELVFPLDVGKEKFSVFTKRIFNNYYFSIK
jgi:hypothetical protein